MLRRLGSVSRGILSHEQRGVESAGVRGRLGSGFLSFSAESGAHLQNSAVPAIVRVMFLSVVLQYLLGFCPEA